MRHIPAQNFFPVLELPAPALTKTKPVTEFQQRQAELDRDRALYREKLAARVDVAAIAGRAVRWVPTLIDRRTPAFQARGRDLVSAAIKRATREELALLRDYVADGEAFATLATQGVLPEGVSDHYRTPLRGGGVARVVNLCLMARETRQELKNRRIWPAVYNQYECRSMQEIEARAGQYLVDPNERGVPQSFIKPVTIGWPTGCIAITEHDLRLKERAALIAREQAAFDADKCGKRAGLGERPHPMRRQGQGRHGPR